MLSSSTESEKERWIEAFTPPKSENPDETLYECWDCPQVTALHNYNGCQPDELSLARGDVINVLRKMNDGNWLSFFFFYIYIFIEKGKEFSLVISDVMYYLEGFTRVVVKRLTSSFSISQSKNGLKWSMFGKNNKDC